jgi:hypothetical protein
MSGMTNDVSNFFHMVARIRVVRLANDNAFIMGCSGGRIELAN